MTFGKRRRLCWLFRRRRRRRARNDRSLVAVYAFCWGGVGGDAGAAEESGAGAVLGLVHGVGEVSCASGVIGGLGRIGSQACRETDVADRMGGSCAAD